MERDCEAKLAAALALHEATQRRIEAERDERAALLAARDAGVTFTDIGEQLGISRQGAHQRYRSLAGDDAA